MSTREVEARLRLKAFDDTGTVFKGLSKRFDRMVRQAGAFNRQAGAMNRSVRRLDRGFMGVAARATTFLAPAAITAGMNVATKRFASFERELQRLVITGEATDDQIGVVKKRIEEVADVAALPIANVKEGFASLLEAGKTVEEALKLLEATSVAAQASDSRAADLATTIIAVGDNLGFAADQAQLAFDIMIKGGKLGKFELKDMAQHLPGLVPQFANLGMKGEEGLIRLVAMMQTVRLQTGDAGQAATALGDLFQKMEVDTVQNKFKKFGIDVRSSLAKARREGKDLIEVFLDLAKEATKGDLSKLPQLIPDKEMRRAVNAMLQERGRLKGFESELDNAAGETAKDLSRLTDDAQASLDRLANSWDQTVRRIGALSAKILVPAFDTLNKALDPDTYTTIRDDPIIAEALREGGTTFGITDRHKKIITAERDKLNAEIGSILARGDSASAMEQSGVQLLRHELAAFNDALARIESQGVDGTRFDFLPPVIQQAGSTFPDDPALKSEIAAPRSKPGDRMTIGLPRSKPGDGVFIGSGRRQPTGSQAAPDLPAPRADFEFLKPVSVDDGAVREAEKAFGDIERAADIDLSAAGNKAMGGFVDGFEQQAARAIMKAEETRAKIEAIMSKPIRANVSISANANIGRGMPNIDEGDG